MSSSCLLVTLRLAKLIFQLSYFSQIYLPAPPPIDLPWSSSMQIGGFSPLLFRVISRNYYDFVSVFPFFKSFENMEFLPIEKSWSWPFIRELACAGVGLGKLHFHKFLKLLVSWIKFAEYHPSFLLKIIFPLAGSSRTLYTLVVNP